MVTHAWSDNVRYTEFTPTTIHYDIELDVFFVARADVRSPAHCHRLGLVVAVTMDDLTVNRLTIADAIRLGRSVLEDLLEAQRGAVDSLSAPSVRIFNLAGVRLR